MIVVAGLGPGGLDRVHPSVLDLLLDPANSVIVRTIHHPAASELALRRQVVTCDDLYDQAETFEDVYQAITQRVLETSATGPVVYAVPGSPLYGELSVRALLDSGSEVGLAPGVSFLDAVLLAVGYDPLDRGLQLLDAHRLPTPLVVDKPTVLAHLDRPEVLAEAAATLSRVVPEHSSVTVVVDAGSGSEKIVVTPIDAVDPGLAGYRTSMFVDTEPGGLVGAVRTMARLRLECPWDREQTHESLVKYLVEETHELIDAVSRLSDDEGKWAAYAGLEDELGDVLLQVLFHAAIAAEAGAFDIDDVAEVMRQKMVRRHPHVFGDVEVATAAEVKANWDQIKESERQDAEGRSILEGVPVGMPALHRASKLQNRAAKVGFDWGSASEVLPKITEELDELRSAVDGSGDVESELGDLLFSIVNLARHVGLDPEIALTKANDRFSERVGRMEQEGPLSGVGLEALNERWERAKAD